ncbi:MAG: hypothetical protein K9N21_03645 [Deltaproteobacteria bacterium]|nr:hypothetical protein [Deltaproteobacteria bacterium]
MVVVENFYSRLPDTRFLDGRPAREYVRRLVKLNALLDKDAHLSRFNEPLLEERLNELEEIGCEHDADAAYGLTLARINELGLLCAGNYADQNEVQGVGDLLFNPRLILVHIRGLPGPVVKERHMGLTEQFADVADTREGVIAWFRDATIIEIEKRPLLPHLYDRLRDSGIVSLQYLDSVMDRTRKIADLTGFLASAYFPRGLDFHQWMQHAGDADKKLLESKLCRFDTSIFCKLGNEFQQALQLRDMQTGFPGKMATDPQSIKKRHSGY